MPTMMLVNAGALISAQKRGTEGLSNIQISFNFLRDCVSIPKGPKGNSPGTRFNPKGLRNKAQPSNPKGIAQQSPGLRAASYPGNDVQPFLSTSKRLCRCNQNQSHT